MRALFLIPLALVACKETNPDFCPAHMDDPRCGGNGSADANNGDGKELDGDPGIDARAIFGSAGYEVKLTTIPTGPVTLPAAIDTSTNTAPCASSTLWVSGTQPAACFIVGTKITVSTAVAVTGSRPLVLVATDSIVVSSKLDAASHINGTNIDTGPGSPFSGCGTGTAPGTSTSGGGGGAGGSFITQGGNGGKGNQNTISGGTPGAIATAPTTLRAGCNGQPGGTGGNGGAAGYGGGAVALIAGAAIDLRAGSINASGSGSLTAGNRGGGGGGGSGGMIVLNAPSILTDSATRMVANGGGGSSGANGSIIGGEAGANTPLTAAPGGNASGGCSNENGGGSGNTLAANGANGSNVTADQCGGGGGGGGGGYIQATVALGSGVFSPAPVIQ